MQIEISKPELVLTLYDTISDAMYRACHQLSTEQINPYAKKYTRELLKEIKQWEVL